MNDIYPQVANTNFLAPTQGETEDTSVVMPRQWMLEQKPFRKPQFTINANQLASLMAMITYISLKAGHSEYRIERCLSDRFNVANAKFLASDDFDEAIRYLADILST
jgi:hypothetical protein